MYNFSTNSVLCLNRRWRKPTETHVHPEEWKLVYSPSNPTIKILMNEVAKSANLEGVVEVDSEDELVEMMLCRKLFAGIAFRQAAVCTLKNH